MIEFRTGDIFSQPDITRIVHQANLYHTIGSGIAAVIKKRFPYALEVDKLTHRGARSKLGWFTVAFPPEGQKLPVIINLYSQDGISATQRTTHYAAMGKAFFDLDECLNDEKDLVLGIPYGIGCGLGGGDWAVVLPIIESVFEKSPVRVVVCKLP